MILDDIMTRKRSDVARRRKSCSLTELMARAVAQPPAQDLVRALAGPGVSLIAEFKRASPSRGPLCLSMDPADVANIYAANGASAISVLTDEGFFQGSLSDLSAVKTALTNAGARLPVLRKDFIFEPYQVVEARAHGADALLLIAAVLSDEALSELLALTAQMGMAALLEVHDEAELDRVLSHSPRVIGINSRDLRTFRVDLATFGRLRPRVPDGIVVVAESGIRTAGDIALLEAMGADAALVGEALVTAPDIAAAVAQLVEAGNL